MAGDVNQVRQEMNMRQRNMAGKLSAAKAAAPAMVEEGLFEYHLYTLQRPHNHFK